MSYTFRKAIREQISLIVAVAGGTGSGKTYSAMRLASGISQGKQFAVIDTENGRANHYADKFSFDVCQLQAPFTPESYADAIVSADKAGYPVILVDSMTHVWAGDGGVLDAQEKELDRMAGSDWKKRESCKMAAWIRPKLSHKAMMSKLLQVKAHLILTFRAEEKIEMVRTDGKMEIRKKESLIGKDGWVPICEKNLPFEATCSFLLLASNPGIPHPIKLQEQMRGFVSLTAPLDEQAGQKMAAWALGGAPATRQEKQAPARQDGGDGVSAPTEHSSTQQGPDAAAPCFTGLLVSYIAKDPTKRTPHRFTFRIGEANDITVSAYESPACLKGGEKLVGARFRFSYEEKPNPRNASSPFRNLTFAEIADPPTSPRAQKGPIAQAQDEKFAEFKALLEEAPEAEILVDLYTGTVTKEWHGCSPGQRQELSELYSTLKRAFGME